MAGLNMIQRLARLVGKDAGPNTYFSSDIGNPDNRNVYVQTKPRKVSLPLGTVTRSDLKRIIKARLSNDWTTPRKGAGHRITGEAIMNKSIFIVCQCGHRADEHASTNGKSHASDSQETGFCSCVYDKTEAARESNRITSYIDFLHIKLKRRFDRIAALEAKAEGAIVKILTGAIETAHAISKTYDIDTEGRIASETISSHLTIDLRNALRRTDPEGAQPNADAVIELFEDLVEATGHTSEDVREITIEVEAYKSEAGDDIGPGLQ